MTRVILGSASASRLAILRRAGLDPEVVVSGVDESAVSAGTPAELAARLAGAKARAVADGRDEGIVIGCDSVLEFAGRAYGKPDSARDALRRWKQMAGRSGVLHTGHCLIDLAAGRSAAAVDSTVVHFAPASDEELAAYVETGEPLGVAGGFQVEGRGGWFVDSIEGNVSNVQGLSLPTVRRLLRELDVRVTDLWVDGGSGC